MPFIDALVRTDILIVIRRGLIGALLLCAACMASEEEPPAPDGPLVDPFAWLADPYVTARRLPGEVRLASSRQPEPPEGSGNEDYNHFVRIDGNEAVLLDARGPGILTRLWFTTRVDGNTQSGDQARLHVYVDGREVPFVAGERGISLGALTSGTLASFPRPWVAGRDIASGAHQILVPIAFQEAIRVTLDHVPERVTYYQIDWRALPRGHRVRSFDGTLSSAEAGALDHATALWVDRTERGAEHVREVIALASHDEQTIRIDGPRVLRRVAINEKGGRLAKLHTALTVDGELVVEESAARWLFAAEPSLPFESALAAFGGDGGSMEYPAPVHAEALFVLRNLGVETLELEVDIDSDPGAPSPELGSLRIACNSPASETLATNVVLLDGPNARGHYAGQSLRMRGAMWGWWMLEGDHEVRVDGAYALLGTGVEDYFGGAFYYLEGPYALPFAGAPGFDLRGFAHLEADRIDVVQYRHHALDTIPLERSFAFEYETTAPGTAFEHCSYWYEDRG